MKEAGSFITVILFSAAFYYLYGKRMIHENHYISNIKETLPLLGVIITIVMFFSALASMYGFVIIHSIYGLVFCLFILTSQMERQKTLVDELDAKIREQLLVTQQAQYKIYKENADLLNVKSHDLKHQIAALRMMYDDKTGEEVINSIAGTVRIYDSFVRTGNDGLDTILTGKNQICLDKNILFTCMVDGKLLSSMDQVDLYSLFGNMMDNAIEAVEKLPESERSISLSVKENLGMILITEENPCGHVKMENGRFVTTKSDKANHGYGLQSMEMVAKKFDGAILTDVKDGVFSLNIMISFE